VPSAQRYQHADEPSKKWPESYIIKIYSNCFKNVLEHSRHFESILENDHFLRVEVVYCHRFEIFCKLSEAVKVTLSHFSCHPIHSAANKRAFL
jgi:hypothetical protein